MQRNDGLVFGGKHSPEQLDATYRITEKLEKFFAAQTPKPFEALKIWMLAQSESNNTGIWQRKITGLDALRGHTLQAAQELSLHVVPDNEWVAGEKCVDVLPVEMITAKVSDVVECRAQRA